MSRTFPEDRIQEEEDEDVTAAWKRRRDFFLKSEMY